eukprot:3334441-Rhodomonas_salina.1
MKKTRFWKEFFSFQGGFPARGFPGQSEHVLHGFCAISGAEIACGAARESKLDHGADCKVPIRLRVPYAMSSTEIPYGTACLRAVQY